MAAFAGLAIHLRPSSPAHQPEENTGEFAKPEDAAGAPTRLRPDQPAPPCPDPLGRSGRPGAGAPRRPQCPRFPAAAVADLRRRRLLGRAEPVLRLSPPCRDPARRGAGTVVKG